VPTKAKYPANWLEVSKWVRYERAEGRCECMGECGLHTTTGRCVEINHEKAKFAKGIVILTAAHTCDCDPLCSNPEHLKAMCNRCHLRLDVDLHVKNAKATRERKKWVNQEPLAFAKTGGVKP
jgi:hypothetical protein